MCYRNGVKVLGTIITEWDEGKRICSEILRDDSTVAAFVDKCVEISSSLGFEGWLVNIENPLDKVFTISMRNAAVIHRWFETLLTLI